MIRPVSTAALILLDKTTPGAGHIIPARACSTLKRLQQPPDGLFLGGGMTGHHGIKGR
jgi:hypothetical protein